MPATTRLAERSLRPHKGRRVNLPKQLASFPAGLKCVLLCADRRMRILILCAAGISCLGTSAIARPLMRVSWKQRHQRYFPPVHGKLILTHKHRLHLSKILIELRTRRFFVFKILTPMNLIPLYVKEIKFFINISCELILTMFRNLACGLFHWMKVLWRPENVTWIINKWSMIYTMQVAQIHPRRAFAVIRLIIMRGWNP